MFVTHRNMIRMDRSRINKQIFDMELQGPGRLYRTDEGGTNEILYFRWPKHMIDWHPRKMKRNKGRPARR